MKSGWFWNTPMWAEYLQEYSKTRPECLHEWKSSPLASDHDFTEYVDEPASAWVKKEHLSQVIDLRTHKWSDVRKSYRGLINKVLKELSVDEYKADFIGRDMGIFKSLHAEANGGQPRNDATYAHQKRWMNSGCGMLVMATAWPTVYAAAYWILWNRCAYYMSGPSLRDNIQHAVILESLRLLKDRGVTFVELGQIDGETEKEKNIGKFKKGFGGEAKPFTIVRMG